MKLYYSPGACSLSPHIAMREAGLDFDLVKVDLKTKKTDAGDDYFAANPSGYVPCLQLDDGRTLTEGPSIVQYIADQAAGKKLAPLNGTFERYQLQQWLNFISTEIHKSFSPLFNPDASADSKATARKTLDARLATAAAQLSKTPYLLGESYSVADIYLFVTLGWAGYMGVDLAPWPALQHFSARVASRDAVQATLRAEGLIQA
jgi:glutathione S-transferase